MFLSIIVTYYNEKKDIYSNVNKIYEFFQNKYNFEVILVDDGNNSDLSNIFNKYKFKNLIIIENDKNYGKGYSIKKELRNPKDQ